MSINNSDLSILRLPHVKERTRLCGSQIYALIAKGLFPRPIKLGGSRASGWVNSEIEDWIRERIKESRSRSA